MTTNTLIEWADHTFNPWIGCTKVSPACDHCYAEARMDKRLHVVHWGAGQPRKRTSPANWRTPLAWERNAKHFLACEKCSMRWHAHSAAGHVCPRCSSKQYHIARQRVFCASLADVFDNEVPPEWREDLFALIRATPSLDWLLLTKRIGNATEMIKAAIANFDIGYVPDFAAWPWPNVWLGATICNQAEADRDIPKLLEVPAAKRFLSIEPMLGPVDLSYWIEPTLNCGSCGEYYDLSEAVPDPDGHIHGADECSRCGVKYCMSSWFGHEAIEEKSRPDGIELDEWDSGYRLHWVICGGESGPNARPMHPDWARSLRDQCQAAGVPFFFKQWGEWAPRDLWSFHVSPRKQCAVKHDGSPVGHDDAPQDVGGHRFELVGKKAAGRLLDGREWNEVPA